MADQPKRPVPRSDRTMFPRTVRRPLTGPQFREAKSAEAVRAKHDPHYITADEARKLPAEVAQRPEVQSRIRYSQPEWPESRSTATKALGPLPTGEGQTVQERTVDAADLFGGQQTKEN